MTSTKQAEANKNNALLSTGATTEEGKAVVSKNAVKHGIFSKDLIVNAGDAKEDEKAYNELLQNLIQSLNPNGQMEQVLVEKIAVDIWRLKRVLKYETGSIRDLAHRVIKVYYSKDRESWDTTPVRQTPAEIDEEVKRLYGNIDWNKKFIKYLKKGSVSFDEPMWENDHIEVNIFDELYFLIDKSCSHIMSEEEKEKRDNIEITFKEIKNIIYRNGYTDKDISALLIDSALKDIEEDMKKIIELEKEKAENVLMNEINIKLSSLPIDDKADKVMRYEKSLQKSIIQNLAVLKKLQSFNLE